MTIADTLTSPTNDEIERAILDALSAIDEELVPWAVLRVGVPGSIGRKAEALTQLWLTGQVYLIKIGGQNYLSVGDEHDARMAATAKAEGRVMELRCL